MRPRTNSGHSLSLLFRCSANPYFQFADSPCSGEALDRTGTFVCVANIFINLIERQSLC